MTRNLKSLDRKTSSPYLGVSGYDIMPQGASFPFEGPDIVTVKTAQGEEPCHSSRLQHIQAFFNQRAKEYQNLNGTVEDWERRWLRSKLPKM